MDPEVKKQVLRMIPYGLYVLTAASSHAELAAGTVNWVTQTSFSPPLVAVSVRMDSTLHQIILDSGTFALNMLGKGQSDVAFSFFKPTERDHDTINGQPFRWGETGAPILEALPGFIECRVVDALSWGDHTLFLGEVVAVGLHQSIIGRADDAILWLKDLGERVYYGG